MREEEIPQSIMGSANLQEDEWGIKTLSVNRIYRIDGVAYYEGLKSDGTKTLFVGIRMGGKRNPNREITWRWFCPDEIQASSLKNFSRIYDQIQAFNEPKRGRANEPSP